jgi:hypothetical protein
VEALGEGGADATGGAGDQDASVGEGGDGSEGHAATVPNDEQ